MDAPPSRRRVRKPPITQTPGFRLFVPIMLGVLVLTAAVIAVLAAAVLLGFLPYPGR